LPNFVELDWLVGTQWLLVWIKVGCPWCGVHSGHGLLSIVHPAKFDSFRLNGFCIEMKVLQKFGCKNLDSGCEMALWVCNL